MNTQKFQPLFSSVAPEAKPLHLQWHWEKIPPGGSVKGWIAGPSVFVWTHYSPYGTKNGDPATKPCYERLINGLIPCPHCKVPKPSKLRKTGYVPILDDRRRRIVVTVSESVGPRVVHLGPYAGVQLWRSQGKRDPIHVKYLNENEIRPCPVRFDSIHGEDITRWLLQLWADDVLSEFYEAADRASQLAATRESTIERNIDYQTNHQAEIPGTVDPPLMPRLPPQVNYFTGVQSPARHLMNGTQEHAAENRAIAKAVTSDGHGTLMYAAGKAIAPENRDIHGEKVKAWERARARGEQVTLNEFREMELDQFEKYLKLESSMPAAGVRDSKPDDQVKQTKKGKGKRKR